MRCFVTGATGFVGGHLCARLMREGHQVVALARSRSKAAALEQLGAEVVEGDLHATNVFARHAAPCDRVFHLAAITRALNAREFRHVNAGGTKSLVEGLNRGEFRGRLVYLSSLAAGGPTRSASQPRNEENADAPVSDYGSSKLLAEKIIVKAGFPAGGDWVFLRPGAIYGPQERQIYEVVKGLNKLGIAIQVGPGVNTQMTHVDDVVDAMVKASDTPAAAGRRYYIVDREVWSFEALVTLIGETLGRRVRVIKGPMLVGTVAAAAVDLASNLARRPLTPFGGDKLREMKAVNWVGDSSRAERELGWTARKRFPDGLRETVKWYRDNGWL